MAEPAAEQIFGVKAVLDHRWRAPLGGDYRVVAQVPPHVVGQVLVAPVRLPGADDVEGLVVQQRDSARPFVAVRAPDRRQEDAVRTAVQRVRPGVAGLGGQLVGLDGAHHPGAARVRFGVQDVGPRRTQARHDQIAALKVARVPGVA
jgi:hypothetical protein